MTSYTAYDQNWFYDPQYLRGIGPQQEGYGYPMQIDQTGMVSAQAAPYPPMPSGAQIPVQPGIPVTPGTLPMEQSYIENILRLNLGKKATIYMTFEGNREWNAKIFTGILEAAGRDHIIISDQDTGKRYLLLMVNLDYITFDEQLNYSYPFQSGFGQGASAR